LLMYCLSLSVIKDDLLFVCCKSLILKPVKRRRHSMKSILIAFALSAVAGCAIVPLACYNCYDPSYGPAYHPSADTYVTSRFPQTGLADNTSFSNADYYGYRYYRPQNPGYYGYGFSRPQYPECHGYRYCRPWY